jgi:hypothetical protein
VLAYAGLFLIEQNPHLDDFIDTGPAPTGADVVDRLRRGEISVQEVLAELEKSR